MAIQARWGLIDLDAPIKVTLLNAGSELLSEENIQSRAAVNNALSKRHISVRNDSIVQRLTEEDVCLKDGTKIPYTHCIWAAGAIAHGLAWKLQSNKLAVSDRGWVSVTPNLQSVSHPFVFAAGDCAEILGLPNGQRSPPKAGVYAVRSGPVLIENLTRFLNQKTKAAVTDEDLIEFIPQNEFLKLIMCGDETAIGFRFGMVLEGKWVWQLKDRIDNMFMDLFRAEHLPSEEQMAERRLDTSQYDSIPAERPPPLDPRDAAILLQRSDDDVPYEQAWDVLRDMMESEEYRGRVTSAARHDVPQPR
jgi:selenide,water dikinase